jgi:hypothetical protein
MSGWLRTYATPISFVTFVGVGLTGLLMFFGIRRGLLGEIHEWVGIVFVVALALHLTRNWRGVLVMLSVPRNKVIITLTSVVAAAFIAISLPFGSGGHRGGFHGPGQIAYRVASTPIGTMAPALGLTSDQAITRLQRGGVRVNGPHQSLTQLAEEQDQEVPRLLNLVLSD